MNNRLLDKSCAWSYSNVTGATADTLWVILYRSWRSTAENVNMFTNAIKVHLWLAHVPGYSNLLRDDK